MAGSARTHTGPRDGGARTKAAILDAAEGIFARDGYASARLEAVAERVGIRRASMVYYFRGKRELYDAVLARVFGDLRRRCRAAVTTARDPEARLDALVDAWAQFVGERPDVARLLLREAAEGGESAAVRHLAGLVATVRATIARGQRAGVFRPLDPLHFIVTIAGATVFFLAITSVPAGDVGSRLVACDRWDAFRHDVLDISRRLLGRDSSGGMRWATTA